MPQKGIIHLQTSLPSPGWIRNQTYGIAFRSSTKAVGEQPCNFHDHVMRIATELVPHSPSFHATPVAAVVE
ncbi:hypothetical protein TNCV_1172681 [Trichonephila clavipes]|uniref:Uncharacterized protein n=1 Tax=Trichonephila clavipes TaxID=2585209 RepID=A0A8X6S2J4_TRICX|nr:hypothetical protein TNCV_1172681 [Trichonephila clavipes]